MEVFAERGYQDAGTAEIARRVRVSRSTVYATVGDKQSGSRRPCSTTPPSVVLRDCTLCAVPVRRVAHCTAHSSGLPARTLYPRRPREPYEKRGGRR